MYSTTQFTELSKANVAQANKLAAVAMASTEKLMALGMSTAKAAIAQGVEGVTAVTSVKDVQELYTLPAKYAESSFQHLVDYSKSLYEISSEAQTAVTALTDEALAGYTKGFSAWVDQASASAPAGSEVAINAFKSSVAATSAAIDQFQKASKQVVSLADANVRAAAETAAKVASAAPIKGRKAA